MNALPDATIGAQLVGNKAKLAWQKTPYPNLIRYVPSGTYFGRAKVNGKLIRRSLETHVPDVAKLQFSDCWHSYQ
jgi:hypothetical protein